MNRYYMKWQDENLPPRLKLIGVIVLLVGLVSALVIYARAGNATGPVLGYEQGNGSVYPMNPEDYKQYSLDMELYGGKENVLLDDLTRWFTGLWQGKSLAFIIACTTILLSSGLFYVAQQLTSLSRTGGSSENDRNGTG